MLSGNEVREKIAGDPDSPYHSLDLNDDLEIEDDYDEEEEPTVTANDSNQMNGYASVKPDAETASAIYSHLESLGINNLIAPSDMHVTLMYSRNKPITVDADPVRVYEAQISGDFEIMGKEPWRALVCLLYTSRCV